MQGLGILLFCSHEEDKNKNVTLHNLYWFDLWTVRFKGAWRDYENSNKAFIFVSFPNELNQEGFSCLALVLGLSRNCDKLAAYILHICTQDFSRIVQTGLVDCRFGFVLQKTIAL